MRVPPGRSMPLSHRLLAALLALAMMFAGSAILWVVAPRQARGAFDRRASAS